MEDEVEVTAAEEEEEAAKEEAKPEVKEKKPAKRGRAAAKAVVEETTQANGETEEVLPKSNLTLCFNEDKFLKRFFCLQNVPAKPLVWKRK